MSLVSFIGFIYWFFKIMKQIISLIFNLYYFNFKKEGTQLPDVTLQEDNPGKTVKIRELFAGKKGVLLGVPG